MKIPVTSWIRFGESFNSFIIIQGLIILRGSTIVILQCFFRASRRSRRFIEFRRKICSKQYMFTVCCPSTQTIRKLFLFNLHYECSWCSDPFLYPSQLQYLLTRSFTKAIKVGWVTFSWFFPTICWSLNVSACFFAIQNE